MLTPLRCQVERGLTNVKKMVRGRGHVAEDEQDEETADGVEE
jgi:hypothetical protein